MLTSSAKRFTRQVSADGTYRSFCLACLRPIGTSFSKEALTNGEKMHRCDAAAGESSALESNRPTN